MKKFVRIVYRKLIDGNSKGPWENYVFQASQREYQLQVQNIENFESCQSQGQLEPDKKMKLDFLVSAAVTGYIQQLSNLIPDVKNVLGRTFLNFTQYQFEIIDSSPAHQRLQTIAVSFYSDWIEWVDTIGDRMLLSLESGTEEKLINLLQLQPYVSIFALKEVKL